MGWYRGNVGDIPRISNFAGAEIVWNDAKPWRNEPATWHPLADRRARHKRIVRINDGDGYMCVLHNTPLVTYHRDGRVELRTHDSTMSHQFAWKVRPEGTSLTSANGYMYWKFTSLKNEELFVRDQSSTSLELRPIRPRAFELLSEPAQDFDEVLNLKKAAAVRKKLSHYGRWYEMTVRLLGPDTAIPRGVSSSSEYRSLIAALLIDSEDPELFHEAFTQGLGPVCTFRDEAYEIEQARIKVPVPHNRLPKQNRR